MHPDDFSPEDFARLPLVVEGESKIVRALDPERVLIEFKPTIYSFTANRAGIVPGSEKLRMQASRVFLDVLRRNKIPHAYLEVGERYVLSRYVNDPPPIEVIVKAYHTGTSKHRYHGMAERQVRASHPFYPEFTFGGDGSYPAPLVRFDWRNPLKHPRSGDKLADEVLGDGQADWYIDTARARALALRTYHALSSFLAEKDIVLYDLCLFIDERGELVFGELSQDCGRYRHFDEGSLDKDVWRAGGSSEQVLEKWRTLLARISGSDKGG